MGSPPEVASAAVDPSSPARHRREDCDDDNEGDEADKEKWAALAETFDFSDDDDAVNGDSAAPLTTSRDGRAAAAAGDTSVRMSSALASSSSSRLLPVRRLEDVCRGNGCRDVQTIDDAALAALRLRFASVYRSKQPCVTRRVAAPWMASSRLGSNPGGVFGAADAPAHRVPVTLLFAKDNETFLGRGGLCERRDGVPAGEAWEHVERHGAGATQRRCYFRAPLGPELWSDVDFHAAETIFGGGGGDGDNNGRGGGEDSGGDDGAGSAREGGATSSGASSPPPGTPGVGGREVAVQEEARGGGGGGGVAIEARARGGGGGPPGAPFSARTAGVWWG
jgi:hypothetical protein